MRAICLALTLFGTVACSTQYGEMGWTGGVESQQIDSRTVRISARGNGYTGSATIQEFALLKAAQHTLGAGYQYFGVVGSENVSRLQSIETPGHAKTTIHGDGSFATASTTYYPGQTIEFVKPGRDVLIYMFSRTEVGPSAQPGIYNASEIVQYLGAKYIKKA